MNGGLYNAALLALVAIVPLVVLMLTSFVKISVVLALLRNAIGAPDAPSGLVVLGLSLVLTFFVMAPVGIDMVRAAGAPGGGSPTQPAPGTRGTPPGGARGATTAPAAPRGNVSAGTATGNVSAGTSAGNVSAGTVAGAPGANVTAGAPGGNVSAGTPGGNGAAGTSANNVSAGTSAGAPGRDVSAGTSAGASGGDVSAGTSAGEGAPRVELEVEQAVRELVPPKYQPQVDAAARALGPLQAFLARHAEARDRDTFVGLAHDMGRAADGDELWVLAPAFLTTELREAFAIAVLVFLPFLVIDLVVGLALAALGLSATQPQTIALPLKLLLFVAVDGWRLLIDSLLRGYV